MKIGRKLSLGFGAVIALMAVVALLVGIMNTMSLGRVEEVARGNSVLASIYEVRVEFCKARFDGRAVITRYTDESYDKFTPGIDKAISDAQSFKDLVSKDGVFAEYASAADNIISDFLEYKKKIGDIKAVYDGTLSNKTTATELGITLSEDFTKVNTTIAKNILTEFETLTLDSITRRTKRVVLIDEAYSNLLTVRANASSVIAFYNPATIDAQVTEINTAAAAVEAALTEAKNNTSKQADKDEVDASIAEMESYKAAIAAYVADMKTSADIGASAADVGDRVDKSIIESADSISVTTNADTGIAVALSAATLAAVLVVVALTIVVSVVIMRIITSSIVPPITRIVSWIKQTGNEGNLMYPQAEWDYQGKISTQTDEIGVLADSYGKMLKLFLYYQDVLNELSNQNLAVDVKVIGAHDNIGNALKTTFASLNEAFQSVNSATSEVQNGAEQISDGAQSLAQGSTEQAATVEELSASVQDILGKTKENSEMAKNTAELSNKVMNNAEAGTVLINDMTKAVSEINSASTEISKVIKVIDDIAFQTNILALNAAVEAARAGEAGKGFAVVADEVRNLASKSAAAAKETNALIENSVTKAGQGSEIASKTSAAFAEIVDGIKGAVELINSISESSDEQANAIIQINTAIEQVSEVVQRNSATAEESAASSEELNAQSDILSRNVAKFRLR
ncbi:hypothetical protein FACS1894133_0670 [Clostridia bacterium]|nr:hypothetical protein FACS1894133_0670 [Clostridia bacterium]